MKFSGVDLDEIKCQLFLVQQAMGQQAMSISGSQAKIILLEADLDAANKTIADMQAKAENDKLKAPPAPVASPTPAKP